MKRRLTKNYDSVAFAYMFVAVLALVNVVVWVLK